MRRAERRANEQLWHYYYVWTSWTKLWKKL